MSKLPEALRLADALERRHPVTQQFLDFSAAAELRRQHALIAELLEALERAAKALEVHAEIDTRYVSMTDRAIIACHDAIAKAIGAE